LSADQRAPILAPVPVTTKVDTFAATGKQLAGGEMEDDDPSVTTFENPLDDGSSGQPRKKGRRRSVAMGDATLVRFPVDFKRDFR